MKATGGRILPIGLWIVLAHAGCSGKGEEGASLMLEAWRPVIEAPDIEVQVIKTARDGVLWFGTYRGGVRRYEPDRDQWTTFSAQDGLAGNDVQAIEEDRTGALWFGTFHGVSRYEPQSGQWTTFSTQDGLVDNAVQAIQEDRTGALWFGTFGEGVSRYEPDRGRWTTFSTKNGLADNRIRAIAEDKRGALWFGTWGGGVSRYEPQSGKWTTFSTPDGLVNKDVRAIQEDSRGALWFGTWGGVSRYEPELDRWTSLSTQDGLADDAVGAVEEDGEGALWFGTNAGGVSRYEPKRGRWTTLSIKSGHMKAIEEDREGALWFAWSGGGVTRYEPKDGWLTEFSTNAVLPDSAVQVIEEDRTGALWFGKSADGIGRYDPKLGQWTTFSTRDGLAGKNVQSIKEDQRGALWFGTSVGGVSRYEPENGRWTTFSTQNGLADNNVRAIEEDQSGALWFGTWGGGASRYEPKISQWTTVSSKNGLADDKVWAIKEDSSGALWFGTSKGGARYEPKSGQWTTFSTESVQAIHEDRSGALWVGTSDGAVRRYEPKSDRWTPVSAPIGVADEVRVIQGDRTGALWFGATGAGVSRYEPKSDRWTPLATQGGLAASDVYALADVRAIREDRAGALWFGMRGGAIRLVLDNKDGEAGAALTVAPSRAERRVAASAGLVLISQPNGLFLIDTKSSSSIAQPILSAVPDRGNVTAVAPGPPGWFWVGTDLGGLTLRARDKELRLTKDRGLPSMTVTALAPVPGTGGASVWVGTSAGPVLVVLEGEELRVQCPQIRRSDIPSGPVDALVASDDGSGSVFVAYNAIPKARFLEAGIAERRTQARIFRMWPRGPSEQPCSISEVGAKAVEKPGAAGERNAADGVAGAVKPIQPPDARELVAAKAFAASEIRALAYSRTHGLFAATSAGLFVAPPQRVAEGESIDTRAYSGLERLEPVTADGRLSLFSFRRMVLAEDRTPALWMTVDGQYDTRPFLVGYDPETLGVSKLTGEQGVPDADSIDDITVTDEGLLLVRAGPHFARAFLPARPARPFWAFAAAAAFLALVGSGAAAAVRRSRLLSIAIPERPLSAIPGALRSLRRLGALNTAWAPLRLPISRTPLVETLAVAAPPTGSPPAAPQLGALAELLGMEGAADAPVLTLGYGLTLLCARLPEPAPLRGHPIALVAADARVVCNAEPDAVRAALGAALNEAGQDPELPYILLSNGELDRAILPTTVDALSLGERDLKALLFAKSPQRTFAGLLHTRGLIALSPYETSGAVKDEHMFFGRAALLRELLLAASPQHILVGPRRVGKTSLLKRLLAEIPRRSPDVEAVFIDLLNIRDLPRAVIRIARALRIDVPAEGQTDAPEVLIDKILRDRYLPASAGADRHKTGVLLIDEADGVVEADAAAGFPLLSAMRVLQAEGVCSFVLAGYLYLYGEALDQRSPLYNFATLRVLGPLDLAAARDLAQKPLERLGVVYADPERLPARIAERTGGYPSIVQLVCDAVLKELTGGDLTITEHHLKRAEESPRVTGYLREIFRQNAGEPARLLTLRLIHRDAFDRGDAERALSHALGRAAHSEDLERALGELQLFGFLAEQDGQFTWTIPLLRDALRSVRGAGTDVPFAKDNSEGLDSET